MATIPTNNQSAVGSNIPNNAVDASEWSRLGPLITAEELVDQHLWGIPLVSQVADPITRVRVRMTPEQVTRRILRAANRVELEIGISILPVQHQVRLGFDRNEYQSLGYVRLPHTPILSVQEVAVVSPAGNRIFTVPNEWVSPGHLQKGQLNLIPLQPAVLAGSSVVQGGGGGAAFLIVMGGQGFIPEFWQVTYIAGFDEGKLPRVMNDIIGADAAIDILSNLASTFQSSSHSLGIDGMSQSVSGPGPQIYMQRIKDLQETKGMLLNKIKALYGRKMFSSSV